MQKSKTEQSVPMKMYIAIGLFMFVTLQWLLPDLPDFTEAFQMWYVLSGTAIVLFASAVASLVAALAFFEVHSRASTSMENSRYGFYFIFWPFLIVLSLEAILAVFAYVSFGDTTLESLAMWLDINSDGELWLDIFVFPLILTALCYVITRWTFSCTTKLRSKNKKEPTM